MAKKLRSCDYTDQQKEYLRQGYLDYSVKDLTSMFNNRFEQNRTESAIKARLQSWGFRSGRTGQFNKSSEPWNKGMKGIHLAPETEFKKGQLPATTNKVGHERVDERDGTVLIKYRLRGDKPGQSNYKPKHVYLWEQSHGPVPPGHVIRFKDGDNRNLSDDNLVCISRHVHMILNRARLSGVPSGYRDTAILCAKIQEKIYGVLKE